MAGSTLSLYNLAPVLQVMGTGLLIAGGLLAWFWVRQRDASLSQRLGALTLLALFLTFDLILFGAFTRLTGSGLGCPDWPGCYGFSSPVGASGDIAAAQALMPTGPVTHAKAWIEMVHRYLATSVGVLIIVLTLATFWAWWRARKNPDSDEQRAQAIVRPWWPLLTLVWICAQGAFGALTVTMKLFPAVVTTHLLGGIGLLVLLVIQAEHYRQAGGQSAAEGLSPGTRGLLWGVTALLAIQIALGGWVSTNYAVLACDTFPKCQGSWWPTMNFSQGFELWRALGHTASGALLGFPALTAIHYVHRLFAYLVIAAMLTLVARLHYDQRLRRQRRWLLGLIALQFLTGLSNVVLGWPLVAAVAHTGGAAALMAVLAWTLCASRAAVLYPSKAGSYTMAPRVTT
ncbi:MAG: heme A synthase [Burkholderiaceae bacterium]|nr:MAG: heme A synthase [Burkholderiaceae bacterium]